VRALLSETGLTIRESRDSFGLIVDMELDPSWKRLAFRADMDALSIQEKACVPYASENPGVMHACGHDFHTAILTGTALALAGMKDRLSVLKRNLRFVFQPAEENNPIGGSRQMIADGALENCEAIFGLHVWPALDTGSVAILPGPVMAASDSFSITLEGASAHAATPHLGIDTIAVAGELISSLNTIVSRKIDPLHPAVITLGQIHGGSRYNIIAEKTVLEGTVRNLYSSTRETIKETISKIACGVAESFGAVATVNYNDGYPVTENSPELARWAAASLKEPLGNDRVITEALPAMTAEDFGYYARERPALFMWLGCSPSHVPEKERIPLHNSAFRADQDCIAVGIRTFVHLALTDL
jgi:amidohydrolase